MRGVPWCTGMRRCNQGSAAGPAQSGCQSPFASACPASHRSRTAACRCAGTRAWQLLHHPRVALLMLVTGGCQQLEDGVHLWKEMFCMGGLDGGPMVSRVAQSETPRSHCVDARAAWTPASSNVISKNLSIMVWNPCQRGWGFSAVLDRSCICCSDTRADVPSQLPTLVCSMMSQIECDACTSSSSPSCLPGAFHFHIFLVPCCAALC